MVGVAKSFLDISTIEPKTEDNVVIPLFDHSWCIWL